MIDTLRGWFKKEDCKIKRTRRNDDNRSASTEVVTINCTHKLLI